jgi:hypothetical protein
MPDWWIEFFWSSTDKAKAAFHRGLAIGFILALVLQSIVIGLMK